MSAIIRRNPEYSSNTTSTNYFLNNPAHLSQNTKALKTLPMADPTPINANHAECCELIENSHQCQNCKGNPWRVGWQKPDDSEDDELSKKGPATAYMLGKFDEFPGYFNDPSLSEEQKRQRIEDAKARILRVLRREAERLGLESPDHWSPEVARPILRARIQHSRARCRVSGRGSSTRPAVEKDEFSAVVAALERLGLEWKPSAEVGIAESVGSDSV